MGKLSEIFANDMIANHACFLKTENVSIDFSTKNIFCDAIPETPPNQKNFEMPHCSNNMPHCSNNSVPVPNSNCVTETQTNVFEGWTDNMVKLLITTYSNHKSKFDDPKFTKKKVWNLISQDLMTKGVSKSGIKCDEKWRNLKKTYDKVKLHLNTSGADKIVWKFYEDFQNIYFKDPYFEPVAVATSSGIKRKTDENTEARNLSPGERKRPKKLMSYLEIENRKHKRHDEKMSLKREMFEWLKENYQKKD